jgi:hypothetical protein
VFKKLQDFDAAKKRVWKKKCSENNNPNAFEK